MNRWIGKVALITGASSGIGAATALKLASKGVTVVGLARREDRIKELASTSSGSINAIRCDLRKENDIIKSFKQIRDKWGGVDILINSAGYIKVGGLVNGSVADWQATLDTNVMALNICTKEAIKSMRTRGDNGHIVHINSISGHVVPQYQKISFGTYVASKYAVTALTECLRVELQGLDSNIKVTSISPGTIHTEMTRRVIGQMMGDYVDESEPLGPQLPSSLEVDDVVNAILYTLGTPPHVQVHELVIQPIGQRIS